MSEHQLPEHDNLVLTHYYNAIKDSEFVVPALEEGTISLARAEDLDNFAEGIFGLGPKSPKYIKKLFVADYSDVAIWEKMPFIIERPCSISSLIETAQEFASEQLYESAGHYSVGILLYVDSQQNLAIKYSQAVYEDTDLVKALRRDPNPKLVYRYDALVTDKPELIDWSDDPLSIIKR